ncbi:MAG: DUF58 domain-containing protein [Planctomycetota bacterium]|nr:MAG: DUF58 domain-containing protein [Planctomycetota bacterium]
MSSESANNPTPLVQRRPPHSAPLRSSPDRAALTSLLSNETLSRLERLRLRPRRRQTNRTQGEHLSGKGGSSIEFSDFRDYVPGDDVRHLDWNIFARLNRPYIKLFQHEEEMHVLVLLDGSASMLFGDKLAAAQRLAAAFGVMSLFGVERLSIHVCGEKEGPLRTLPPCRGRVNLTRMLRFLESVEGGGTQRIDEAIEDVLKTHRGRGIAVVLSDFLTAGDLRRPFNRLYSAGLELMAIQILAPEEIDPDIAGDWRFVDAETQQTLDISSAAELLGLYHEHRQALERFLESECRKRNGRFLSIASDEPVESVVFDKLQRQGWIR